MIGENMSHLAIHGSAALPVDPRAGWITPEEQLLQLALPLAMDRVRTCRMRVSLDLEKPPELLTGNRCSKSILQVQEPEEKI
jgi:hypothetical protein